ncbi:hypothetical protein GCM10022378_11230 [Salinicoccus jeotgali]|uniref:HTH cro/C1-type domain-containing protein n=1 Tax=Salinicoccus jeotgali TaxID=381634 RepID=A0ABP7EVR5_9STAP
MKSSIVRYRKRTGATQQDVANMLFTDKSQVCKIEKGDRTMTVSMYEAGFNNVPDPHLLNDMAHEVTGGYTMPTPSNRVYDDHRMSFRFRIQKEIEEFTDMLPQIRLDKHPEFLTREEKESVTRIASELQDVLFEGQGMLMKLLDDYGIPPKEINQGRDARLRMERRI